MDREEQLNEMRTWFFENYGEPVNLLPYVSSEGGYIPIYGSLQYADDILYSQYYDDVSEDIIKELIDELDELELWSPLPDETYYDEDYSDIVFYDTDVIIHNALTTFENIKKQIYIVNQMNEYKDDFMRMLFAKVYATIESFLFDYAVNYSLENLEIVLPILDKISHLKKHSIFFEELNKLKASQSLENDVDKLIKEKISHSFLGLIWHRFDDVRKIYKKLGYDIDTTELKKYLYIRNDIVHRDGRKKEDMSTYHAIEEEIINKLIEESCNIINVFQTPIDEIQIDF